MSLNLIRRKVARIVPKHTAFFQCDIQGVFEKLIYKMPIVTNTCIRMAKTSQILGIPMVITEQTPEKLGYTLDSIAKHHPEGTPVFHKTTFSMMTDEVTEYFNSLEKDTVVLYGIEGHVCVQQTALDLVGMGVDVHLLTDGVSSTDPHKRATSIRRMTQAGVKLTTFESCLYEMLGSSEHEKFRELLREVVKDTPSDRFERI